MESTSNPVHVRSGCRNGRNNEQLCTITDFFLQYYSLSREVQDHINRSAFSDRLQKGAVWTPKENIGYLMIVQKGVLRGYLSIGKKEITTWIADEQKLVIIPENKGTEGSSTECITALEDCWCEIIHFKQLQNLTTYCPEIHQVVLALLDQYAKEVQRRVFIVSQPRAIDRYKLFIKMYNHLANRIPLTVIASFLRVELPSLSRIRRKIVDLKREGKGTD